MSPIGRQTLFPSGVRQGRPWGRYLTIKPHAVCVWVHSSDQASAHLTVVSPKHLVLAKGFTELAVDTIFNHLCLYP